MGIRTNATAAVAKLGVATILGLAAVALSNAPAEAASRYGCPQDFGCSYDTDNPDDISSDNLRDAWYEGIYRISYNGTKVIFNNQPGEWVVDVCKGRRGNDCPITIESQQITVVDMTPIHSVSLHK